MKEKAEEAIALVEFLKLIESETGMAIFAGSGWENES